MNRKKKRKEEAGVEWIKLLLCLALVLVIGILLRTEVFQLEAVRKILLRSDPEISFKEHTVETLMRIGELFYGSD